MAIPHDLKIQFSFSKWAQLVATPEAIHMSVKSPTRTLAGRGPESGPS